MRQFRSVLWVFDQDTGTAALEWVASLAKHPLTQLTVVEVMEPAPGDVPPPRPSVPSGDSDEPLGPAVERERRRLEQAVDALRAQGIHPDIRVLLGVPCLEISRQVLRGGHDLLIVSAQGNCGMRERVAESPALHLARTCPCPVSLHRSARGEPRSGILAVLDADEAKHEDLNLKILDLAYGLAQGENSEIHVLHPRTTDQESVPRTCTSAAYRSRRQLSVDNCLQDQKPLDSRRAESRPLDRTTHFYYLRGPAAPLICRLAHDRQMDVIVLGATWQPGAKEHALSTIAETVLQEADCSVLIVKPDSVTSPVLA
jgi:universal stress protein E